MSRIAEHAQTRYKRKGGSMARCVKCSARGLFLRLDSNRECADCAERRRRKAYEKRAVEKSFSNNVPPANIAPPVSAMAVQAKDERTAQLNAFLHETELNEVYKSIADPYDAKMVQIASSIRSDIPLDDQISKLEQYIALYYELEQKCKDYSEEISDIFRRRNMRKNIDTGEEQSIVAKREQHLAELKEHHDAIISLENDVIEGIISNQGIKQTEFYKLFDPYFHARIKSILYDWAKLGVIRRIKSGSTYQLYFDE